MGTKSRGAARGAALGAGRGAPVRWPGHGPTDPAAVGRQGKQQQLQQQVPCGITRKILRKGSRVLQVLKGMVGNSHKIFTQVRTFAVPLG